MKWCWSHCWLLDVAAVWNLGTTPLQLCGPSCVEPWYNPTPAVWNLGSLTFVCVCPQVTVTATLCLMAAWIMDTVTEDMTTRANMEDMDMDTGTHTVMMFTDTVMEDTDIATKNHTVTVRLSWCLTDITSVQSFCGKEKTSEREDEQGTFSLESCTLETESNWQRFFISTSHHIFSQQTFTWINVYLKAADKCSWLLCCVWFVDELQHTPGKGASKQILQGETHHCTRLISRFTSWMKLRAMWWLFFKFQT